MLLPICYQSHVIKRKGLTANRRKSLCTNECERGDSNPHELCPLDPKSSASANSATLAGELNHFYSTFSVDLLLDLR